MDLYRQRIDHRDTNGWEECTSDSTSIFNETGLDAVQGVGILIREVADSRTAGFFIRDTACSHCIPPYIWCGVLLQLGLIFTSNEAFLLS